MEKNSKKPKKYYLITEFPNGTIVEWIWSELWDGPIEGWKNKKYYKIEYK
jgi:hypothetical protein